MKPADDMVPYRHLAYAVLNLCLLHTRSANRRDRAEAIEFFTSPVTRELRTLWCDLVDESADRLEREFHEGRLPVSLPRGYVLRRRAASKLPRREGAA